MNILGVAFLSDASAVVIRDGKLAAGVSEERLNRTKLWHGVPQGAIKAVLNIAGLELKDIDLVATHGEAPSVPDPKPFEEKKSHIREADLTEDVRDAQIAHIQSRFEHERMVLGERTPAYLAEIYSLGRPVKIYPHHKAHAAGAYFGSGWNECFVLTADGWGEDASATLWEVDNGELKIISRSHTFDSLGYFYGSVTKALGFTPHRHEGKVLGLAAYCQNPRSYLKIREMIDYDPQNQSFIGRMEKGLYAPRFENQHLKEFVADFPREDIAASTQRALEEVVCELVSGLGSGKFRLALAGGVFANVKLNQRIREIPAVSEVYVFPNMGDGGLSAGAAWLAYSETNSGPPAAINGVLLGHSPNDSEIDSALSQSGLRFNRCPGIEVRIAELLAEGNVVARCSGPMEYGPRALGNRSIFFHAGDKTVNDWLNNQLQRSEFMPFAPATLAEHAHLYFKDIEKSRNASNYMTITFDCTERMLNEAPAAVHVDGTARPQIVSRERYPEFHKILSAYHDLTGFSNIINTSFNMHEEPIVCTASDAVRAFRDSKLPYMALGNYLVEGVETISSSVEHKGLLSKKE